MEERVSLLEVLRILVRNRKAMLLSVLGAALVSAAISVVLPKWYKASAVILPPESAMNQPDYSMMMRLAGYKPALIPSMTSQSEIYGAILSSETVVDAVIDSLDLMRAFGTGSRRDSRDRVRTHMAVSVTEEGLVRIEYEDRNEARSVDVANGFVNQLDRFSRETMTTSARRVRQFIEGRLEDASAELDSAQNALKAFKEATGAIMISEQATASIKTAAEIYGKITDLEVGLERVSQYATERSPEVVDIKSQIRALERKLAEMGYIGAGAGDGGGITLFPRFSSAPELEKRFEDLLTQVEMKRAIYAALGEQYEQAKISETRDTPTIQVLDWAKKPLLRSKPKRKAIVGVSAVSALVLASFVILMRERLGTAASAADREVLSDIGNMLASDLRHAKALLRPRGNKPGN
jgi:uncharacterized protein involved in exopolysaccharide biosynthesis